MNRGAVLQMRGVAAVCWPLLAMLMQPVCDSECMASCFHTAVRTMLQNAAFPLHSHRCLALHGQLCGAACT